MEWLLIQLSSPEKIRYFFCRSKPQSNSPYDGIHLLDKLLSRDGAVAPELHLLKCIELNHLEDLESAEASLDTYRNLTKQTLTHPLYLVAKARLSKTKSDSQDSQKCLAKFAELFPQAVENWLTETEKSVVAGTSGKGSKIGAANETTDPVKRYFYFYYFLLKWL